MGGRAAVGGRRKFNIELAVGVAGVLAALVVGAMAFFQQAHIQSKDEAALEKARIDARYEQARARVDALENRVTALEKWEEDTYR